MRSFFLANSENCPSEGVIQPQMDVEGKRPYIKKLRNGNGIDMVKEKR